LGAVRAADVLAVLRIRRIPRAKPFIAWKAGNPARNRPFTRLVEGFFAPIAPYSMDGRGERYAAIAQEENSTHV
jgi:hypothetical protein